MAVEGVSWGLKLGEQATLKYTWKNLVEALKQCFWGTGIRTALAEWPSFPGVCGDQWDKGRKDLRGICELYPETIIFMAFSSEIPLSTDALAPNTPQGVKGRQRIFFLAVIAGIWIKSRGMVEMMLCFELSTWNLVWIQKLFVQAFAFESWNFTVTWWLGPGVNLLYFQ